MEESKKMTKPVVVVGGSFAGLGIIRNLDPKYRVILIEPRDYFEYSPGILHVLCGSGAEETIMQPLSTFVGRTQHIRGIVIGIHCELRRAVVGLFDDIPTLKPSIKQTIEITYDAIVFCDGRYYSPPVRPLQPWGNLRSRALELQLCLDYLNKSRNIVVVGGGLVGIELVAELATRLRRHKDGTRDIVLLTRALCLSGLPTRAAYLSREWLIASGVTVIENDGILAIRKLDSKEEDMNHSLGPISIAVNDVEIQTTRGKVFRVDTILDCTGAMNSNIKSSCLPTLAAVRMEAIDAYNASRDESDEIFWPKEADNTIFVANTFQAIDVDKRVFACGDCVLMSENFNEVRSAYIAEHQAKLCAHNVSSFLDQIAGDDSTVDDSMPVSERIYTTTNRISMQRFPRDEFGSDQSPRVILISLGKWHAILIFNNLVIGGSGIMGWLCALSKYVVERAKIFELQRWRWAR